MAEKKAPRAQTKGGIGAVEAYEILKQRQISEDRILAERTSMFLLATSFLFLAFVTLLNPDWEDCIFTVLRILLPSVGIFLTILLFFFNQSASIASAFWHKAQRKIEHIAPEFDYMRSSELTPHIALDKVMEGEKEWVKDEENDYWVLKPVVKPKHWWQKRLWHNNIIYRYCLPPAFFVLWTVSLVFVIVCYP